MNLISVEDIAVRYGGNIVLQKVDLDIEQGEIVTVVGPNGSGKTSLLKAIIGAVKPVKGRVTLRRGLKIGYVPQYGGYFHDLTLLDNLRAIGEIQVPDFKKRNSSRRVFDYYVKIVKNR